MLVNFYTQLNNEPEFFIAKELDSIQLAEFVMEFYGEMNIYRRVSNELEVCIIVYSRLDLNHIENQLIKL